MYGLKSTPAAPPFTEVAFLPLLRRQLSLFDNNNKVHIKMFIPMHLFSPRHSPKGFGSALGLGREKVGEKIRSDRCVGTPYRVNR